MQNQEFSAPVAVVKGLCISLLASVVFALLFACALPFFSLSERGVYTVNQVGKTLCLAAGTLLCVRGEKGWLQGGALGLLFTASSYLLFSAIGGDFSLGWLLCLELLVGVISGALCGSIAVNVKK